MWAFWVLFWTSLVMDSCRCHVMQLTHGVQLNIRLQKDAGSLLFASLNGTRDILIWPWVDKPIKGQVTRQGNDKHFVINYVTFDDQGNYIQKNSNSKVIATVKVRVVQSVLETDCVAGETLKISLKGLTSDQATLSFYSQDLNLTLVDHGRPVAKNHPDYYDRLKVTTDAIEVLNVNVSDVGKYVVKDRQGRVVSAVSMKLVDHHEKNLSPLVALMLLLGVPAGICCCCRKRIFKKSGPATTTIMHSGNQIPPPGPPPSYNTVVVPAAPGPVNIRDYTTPGESKVHPPPNPPFAPQPYYGGHPAMPPNPMNTPSNPPFAPQPYYGGHPAMPPNLGISSEIPAYQPVPPGNPAMPPAQWNTTSYTTPASASLAPVMFHAPASPASVTGEIKMNEIPAATPLLTPSQPEVGQPPGSSIDANFLYSNPGIQFNMGKNTTSNFL